MKIQDLEHPILTEQAIYEAIAFNPESISRDTLLNYFGLRSAQGYELDAHIGALVRAQKIYRTPDNANRFEAVSPLSDVVVARVIDKPVRGRARLEIENVNFDLPMVVTISEKQVRSYRLKQAERILVLLDRHKGSELKAKFMERFSRGKPVTLNGKFNDSAADSFAPLDKRIKTRFKASSIPGVLDPRAPYYAQIPVGFDPHNPRVVVGEQKWDPQTGNRIYEVIASNHGLKPRHDKSTAIEARKSARRKIDTAGRRDLTGIPIFVVDPPDARDHDDGILVERMPGGFRTLTVVADVPFYVRSHTLLDDAARTRGFTHYFPDETYHMLPLELGTGVCSLKEGAVRPVVYVEQLRDLDGVPYKTEIGLGYIDAQRQLTYAQFQQFLASDNPMAHPYRELQSSLDIKQYDTEILMESASTDHRYGDAQLIVQAMMVDANKAIANFLDYKNLPYLRRTHAGHINPLAYAEIAAEFEAMGYEIPSDVYDLTPASINDLLGQAAIQGEKDRIQSMILLKLLEPALYSTRSLMHWGLTADAYTHATSPIRRYADILTLRSVHDALDDPACGLSARDEEHLENIGKSLNYLQVINRNVQHDRVKYYAIKDLYHQEKNSVRAMLSGVHPEGIEIFLLNYGLKKMIPASQLPTGWKCADNGMGISDGNIYIPKGSPVRVTISDVQPHKAQWGISRLEAVKDNYLVEIDRKNASARRQKTPRRSAISTAPAPAGAIHPPSPAA